MQHGGTHLVYRPDPVGPTSLHEVGTQLDWSLSAAKHGMWIDLVENGQLAAKERLNEFLPHLSLVMAFRKKDGTWALIPATGSSSRPCSVLVSSVMQVYSEPSTKPQEPERPQCRILSFEARKGPLSKPHE
jgi:hypothetical protein